MENYTHYYGSVYDKYSEFRLFILNSLKAIPNFSNFIQVLNGNEVENFNSFCLEFYELDYDGFEGSSYSKWSVNYSAFSNDVATLKLLFRGYGLESKYTVKNLKTEEFLNLFTDEYYGFISNLSDAEVSFYNGIDIKHSVDKFNFWINLFSKEIENLYSDYKFEYVFDYDVY